MITKTFVTTCPGCGAQHKYATSMKAGDDTRPDEGDAIFCFDCGRLSIFAPDLDGGLRYPDASEQATLDADPEIKAVRNAWWRTTGKSLE